ncbi:MFS transporter [Marinospirillum alkaliphilum]|uniref:Predicted arabinose efflux permease, MFS family n=1 Tax=Marinospirillum alkaliphilum DSM 21637 TaxID=1122209 RepID=A0A1K1VXN8_9GAMM|nr:MFS transporter [Marinospirillum alkaliphilum]SFX29934.1 Predicted arabinose efflux permease, MFS family [Marinospirillum alkaliphilum DSM 21637]
MHQLLSHYPLAVIVLAQLFGTSLWFSINGVALNLMQDTGLTEAGLGHLTLAVQAGFITGTLLLAITGLADRFRASRIFALAACLGAVINGLFILAAEVFSLALLLRFLTGLCLAGIYPLGMKLVISWTPQQAGMALSWLVGMLTLGTATPHLLRAVTPGLYWPIPLLMASLLALMAALLILLLGEGRHLPTQGRGMLPLQGLAAWRDATFRRISGGYFGHCWELYAFWTLVPFLVLRETLRLELSPGWVSWLAFAVIGIGLAGCVLGGFFSRCITSLTVARTALAGSGLLCLIYPLLGDLPAALLLGLLLLWGLLVIADSPQFSALASANAPRQHLGSALAMMNAIGFGLTVPAIALVTSLWSLMDLWVVYLLLPGPLIGLWLLKQIRQEQLKQM